MFTGLVEAWVPVLRYEKRGAGARLVLPSPPRSAETTDPWPAGIGESVAISGCCLTVVGFADPESGAELDVRTEALGDRGPEGAAMCFDLSAETLERTWLGDLAPGRPVNLERSLRLGDRLGGHLVSGHVDGRGRVVEVTESGDGGRVLGFEVEDGFERFLIEKGSVAVDGVSLTVVRPRDARFEVALIPATLELTSLGSAEVGQPVNLESDPVGKWIEKLVAPWRPA